MDQDWPTLYNIFRGPDWPDCPLEKDFHLLPAWIQEELIVKFGYDPYSANAVQYNEFFCNGATPITVFYTMDTDGGGSSFGQDYIPVIKQQYGNKKFKKVFEWCSGPGFIGFSLLSHNMCDKLCFNDLYDPAIELIHHTAKHPDNNCSDVVSAYLLKDLSLLPAHEMFDLVVSNPPHFSKYVSNLANKNRICSDINWESHKNFFNNIKSHLTEDGVILLQENKQGSTIQDFEKIILEAGLTITDCFDSILDPFYYIEIKANNQ